MYVFVMYYKQQSINLFLAWYDSQPVCTVIYSKSLLFTSISYLQGSFKLSQSWINVFFCIGGFPFTYLLSLALAKKSCNNINNSPTQVSRLCYFLWLCLHVLQGLLVIKYTKKLLNVVEKYYYILWKKSSPVKLYLNNFSLLFSTYCRKCFAVLRKPLSKIVVWGLLPGIFSILFFRLSK